MPKARRVKAQVYLSQFGPLCARDCKTGAIHFMVDGALSQFQVDAAWHGLRGMVTLPSGTYDVRRVSIKKCTTLLQAIHNIMREFPSTHAYRSRRETRLLRSDAFGLGFSSINVKDLLTVRAAVMPSAPPCVSLPVERGLDVTASKGSHERISKYGIGRLVCIIQNEFDPIAKVHGTKGYIHMSSGCIHKTADRVSISDDFVVVYPQRDFEVKASPVLVAKAFISECVQVSNATSFEDYASTAEFSRMVDAASRSDWETVETCLGRRVLLPDAGDSDPEQLRARAMRSLQQRAHTDIPLVEIAVEILSSDAM